MRTASTDFARIHDPACRKHFVYRAYDGDGRLLYVGCSMNLDRRRKEHKTDSDWFDLAVRFRLAGPYNYQTARALEREAIKTEGPLYNGDTPGRLALMRRASEFVTAEWQRLMTAGVPMNEALSRAVDASEGMAPAGRGPYIASEWS